MRSSALRPVCASARAAVVPIAAWLCAGCYPPEGPYDLIGNGEDACGPGSVAEMADDFDDDVKAESWAGYADPSGSIAEVNGQVEMHVDGSTNAFTGYAWIGGARSLVDCHVGVQVKRVGSRGGDVFTYLSVPAADDSGKLDMTHAGNTLSMAVSAGGASTTQSVPYDPVTHGWWRIREAEGTVSFEASADGRAWLPLLSAATPAFAAAVGLNVGMGVNMAVPGGGFAIIDNLNVEP